MYSTSSFLANFQIHFVSLTSFVLIHLKNPYLSSSLLSIHYSFILSLQAQNLPFRQILPTLTDFWYPLDCIQGSLDWIGLSYAYRFIFSSFFTFLKIPCSRLRWLPEYNTVAVRARDTPARSVTNRPAINWGWQTWLMCSRLRWLPADIIP